MGDLIELTTWPNHQNVFYKVNSSGISFDVKAPGNASIGLAKKPGRSCDLLVALGHNRHSWIKKPHSNEDKRMVETPNILSPDVYKTFWIKWFGDSVRVGQDGQTIPLIVYNCKMPDLMYVTFSVIDQQRNSVQWRFHVPPILERPRLKSIVGGQLNWVEVDSERPFPDDALIGGYEKENLYIIRAKHSGSLTPGKFVSSEGVGYISWGGDAHDKDSFEVLCGFDCVWVPSSFDKIPVGAVVGGHSETSDHEKLYIGRIKHEGYVIPGKIQPSHSVCYVAYDGKEIPKQDYEVLVCPHKMRTVNKWLIPHIETGLDDSDDDDDNDNENDHDHDYYDFYDPDAYEIEAD